MVIVLQKKSKVQNALYYKSKTYLVEEGTAVRKYILLIRITNQETTDYWITWFNDVLLHKERGSTLQRK